MEDVIHFTGLRADSVDLEVSNHVIYVIVVDRASLKSSSQVKYSRVEFEGELRIEMKVQVTRLYSLSSPQSRTQTYIR